MAEYESAIARYFSARFALAVSSGSSALYAAFWAAGVGPGHEVIVPALAPLPTILPVLALGARPVFVDTAPGSLEYDTSDLWAAVTSKTRAVCLLPLWGYPVLRPALAHTEAPRNGAPVVIEDAAQAHGSRLGGHLAGTLGDIGCFSTHDQKLLATGEGGFIITNDETSYRSMESFTRLGHLDGVSPGVNFKLSALQAALGIGGLALLEERVSRRKEWAARYRSVIDVIEGVEEIPLAADSSPNYYSFVMYGPRIDSGVRSRLAERGVVSDQLRHSFKPGYHHPIFAEYRRPCSNAENFVEHCATLPIVPELGEDVLDYICNAISASVG